MLKVLVSDQWSPCKSPPNMIDSSACHCPAHGSPHRIRKSAPQRYEIYCPFAMQLFHERLCVKDLEQSKLIFELKGKPNAQFTLSTTVPQI